MALPKPGSENGTPGRPPLRTDAPHGPDAVRAALLAAASRLFAERGPSAVSVREVAEAAHVNHGLVHKYFGSKDGLLSAVLEQLATESAREVAVHDGLGPLYDADGPARRQGRIFAALILEGRDIRGLTSSYPTLEVLVRRFERAGLGPAEARHRAVQTVALVLGWEFFEPFLRLAVSEVGGPGASRGEEGGDVGREQLEDALARLWGAPRLTS